MDSRLVILGLAAALLLVAVAYLISAVASARRARRRLGGSAAEGEIVPFAPSDAPIELGGWAPSAEPQQVGPRVGVNFADIAPGTVHGQERQTHHEVVDVEPGATLLSIEDLIRQHAQTPVPERPLAAGASIDTLLHAERIEVPAVAEPVRVGAMEAGERADTQRVPREPETAVVPPVETAPSPAEGLGLSPGRRAVPAAAVVPSVAESAPGPAARPWFMEAEAAPAEAPVPILPPTPERTEPLQAPATVDTTQVASVPGLEELLGGLEPIEHAGAAEPESPAMDAPVPRPEPEYRPQPQPEPQPAPEPDPHLLLQSLLAEPAVTSVPMTPPLEATPAAPSPAPPRAESGVVAPMGAGPAVAPAVPVASRPTARDVGEVPAYRMVAPIELWFADGPPRVGIRPGTPTYLKYQRLAQVLLTDLRKARR